MKVRPGAVIRGAGVALACLAPDPSKRSAILLAGFTGGWFLNKPGLQVFTIIPDAEEPWKHATVPFTRSVASWSTVMLAATTAVRRTSLPAPIAAVVLGSGLIVIDSFSQIWARRVTRLRQRTPRQRNPSGIDQTRPLTPVSSA